MNSISQFLRIRKRQESLFMYLVKALCLVFFLSTSASAAVWQIDPRVTLGQGYDDNYFLSSNSSQEAEVWTTALTGELALRGKSERMDMEALLRLDGVKYGGDDRELDDNKDNQFLGISSKFKASERNALSLNARLNRDTIVRTGEVIIDPEGTVTQDDVGIEETDDTDINLVDQNVRRTRISINPGWNYQFSDRTQGKLEYRYDDLSYSNEGGSNLQEYDRQSIGSRLRHRLSEKNVITGRMNASFFRPENDNDTDTYEARLGFIRKFSETLQLDFTFGGRYSEFDNAADNDDSGFVANIGATKFAGLTTYRVNLERSVNPSGSGNQVETDEIKLDIRHAISETLSFNLGARAFETEDTGNSSSSSGRDYLSIEPGLSWQFSSSWNASLSYRYRERDRDGDPDGSGDSNSAFVNFSYFPPRQF